MSSKLSQSPSSLPSSAYLHCHVANVPPPSGLATSATVLVCEGPTASQTLAPRRPQLPRASPVPRASSGPGRAVPWPEGHRIRPAAGRRPIVFHFFVSTTVPGRKGNVTSLGPVWQSANGVRTSTTVPGARGNVTSLGPVWQQVPTVGKNPAIRLVTTFNVPTVRQERSSN